MAGHRIGNTEISLSRRRALQIAGGMLAGPALAASPSSFSVLGSRLSALAQEATPSPFGQPTTTGGTYTVAGVGSGVPRIFVPTSYYGTTAFYVCKLLYTPLVRLDQNWANLGPGLATEWSWNEAQTQLTMKLREGVRFHDGQPLTADDVVFTYRLMVRTDLSPAVQDLTVLQGAQEYKDGTTEEFPAVVALDPTTVQFNLSAPANTFLQNLSNCGILPAHAFGDDAVAAGGAIEKLPFFNFESGPPIGTGAWKVKDYQPETNLTFEANPDYYKGRPILDQLNLLLGITGSAGIAGLQAGEYDALFVGSNYQDIKSLEGSDQYSLTAEYALANEQVLITATEKPYLPVSVRQALVTALDIPTLISTLTFDYAKPAASIMMHPSLFPNPSLPAYSYDPEKAKQLLTEGGWDGSKTLKFGRFIAQGTPDNIAVAMIDMWKAVGVNAEYTPLDPAAQVDLARVDDHAYDVVLTAFAWLAYDPSSSFSSFACSRRPDYSNYCNPDYDAAMQAAIRSLDPAAAVASYQQAQTILQTELPYAPLWIEPATWAIGTKVHGGILGRGPLNDNLSELWWKES